MSDNHRRAVVLIEWLVRSWCLEGEQPPCPVMPRPPRGRRVVFVMQEVEA